ncbi:MAG: GumC family protein [Desulfobulbaceae bacterium]|jgi:uncharacterized protein involved in exopolysaccharide biosynthesis|nr:GumC family protein [Desulfobulbaceae bacterium]
MQETHAIQEQEEESINIDEYLRILKKHWRLIAAVAVFVMAMTILVTILMTPMYQGTAVLVIDKEQKTSPLTGEDLGGGSFQDEQLTFNTHFKLITSRPVLVEVIRELKLDQQEELESNFFKSLIQQFRANIKLLFAGDEQKEPSEEQKLDGLVKALQDSINIEATKQTRLLEISVENRDAEMARDIANTLAKKYIEFNVNNRLQASKDTVAWMYNELYATKKKLEDDEQKFLEYKKANNVFSVEGKQQVIGQKITEFNTEYLTARNKRLELDEKLKEIERYGGNTADMVHIRSIVGNPAIDSIYSALTTLEVEQSKLSKVYRGKHPKMIQVTSEIDKLRAKLRNELEKEIGNLRSERAVLSAREQVMEKNISEFEGDALEAGGKELQYNILQRNVTTSQSLYDTLLAKIKESNVLVSGYTSNIRIVGLATLPERPFKPKKMLNLAVGLLLGLLGGCGLAFALDFFNQSLKNEDDVLNYLGIPVLAMIPEATDADKNEV